MITEYPAGFEPPHAVNAAAWRAVLRGLLEGRSGGSQHPMRTPVIGYLRSARPDRSALDLLVERLTAHAAANNLQLVAVYRDDGVPNTAPKRSAFTAMLTALEEGKAAGVLIPDAKHLACDDDLRSVLTARIEQTGATLYLIET